MTQEIIKITKPKKQNGFGNLVEIKLVITEGKALALFQALENYETPVGNDLLDGLVRESQGVVRFTRNQLEL